MFAKLFPVRPRPRRLTENASEAATLSGTPVVFRLPVLMICLSEFAQLRCSLNIWSSFGKILHALTPCLNDDEEGYGGCGCKRWSAL